MQIPPAKIADIVKAVLKSMVPLADVESIELPKRSASLYMRNAKLSTVCSAHQATVLANASVLHLNTDGATAETHSIINK